MKARSMGLAKKLVTAVAAGAGALYLFDPRRGESRRRALTSRVRGLLDRVSGGGRTASPRADDPPVDDPVLVQRIRSEMGRYVRNANEIAVASVDGVVTVNGPVLVDELPALLRVIRSVSGVRMVQDELEVHEYPDETDLARDEERFARRN